MAIISARLEGHERQKLRDEARTLGFETMSDFIRHKLGLEKGFGPSAPLPEFDEGIEHSLHSLIERIDNMNANLKIIAKHVGATLKPDVRVRVHEPEPVEAGGFQR